MSKIFDPHHHQAKKRFGQNFLQDQSVIDRIRGAIRARKGENLVEIGPGLGALTRAVLADCEKMTVIELDKTVIPKLRFNCDGLGELSIVEKDALKIDFSELAENGPMRVIGNLPYNISTPLLFHLFQFREHIVDMHFMLQKEVVKRIVAAPGSKTYGRLSIMSQIFCQSELLFVVPPEAFTPAPKVDSAIIRMRPQPNPPQIDDFSLLSAMVSDAFNQRRKTLRNVWKKRLEQDDWNQLAIEPTLRPENLSVADFVRVANHCAQKNVK